MAIIESASADVDQEEPSSSTDGRCDDPDAIVMPVYIESDDDGLHLDEAEGSDGKL